MNSSQAETPRKHILVVDDSRDNLRLLSGILIQEGYTVRPVLDGQLALSSAKTNPPDVILLDIMMPGMTGFDVCELLKTEPTLRDIPVIFISALNSVLDKVKAFSVGGVDYITKPFHPQEVLARIKTHLTLRHLQQSLQDNNQTLQREIAERRRIEAAMRQRNWELDLLNQLTNLLQGCQDERATYRVIANICQQLFPKISGGLYLLNDRQTEIQIAEYWGASPSSATVLTHPDWEMLTGQIITLEQPKDKPIQIYFSEARGNAAPPYALRGTDGEIFGMLFFDFEACDYETLEAASIQEAESRQLIATRVAEQYALFLSNLRMRAVLERQVTRDPLTDLYNRRYMEEALLNEMHRVVRKRASLGIIMVDVDHFKLFNDTHGHEAGDVVLQQIGSLFQKNIRGGDMACRYGGEEFLLILPDASLAATEQRAKELLGRVREMRIVYNDHAFHITASLGVAAAPEHGQDAHSVVNAADIALYHAKNAGRDQVAVFSQQDRPLPPPH